MYAERLKLLIDGRAAYPEMLSAIAAARNTVELETYILAADRTGERFSAVLCAAAQRGVRVRLLYDDVGSLGLSHAYVAKLQHAGVAVSVYHPLRLSRPTWAVNRRDHRKILVVDRTTAFTGGLNIANDYAAVEEGGAGWRDTHLRLDGPRVGAALSALFEEVWKVAKPLPEPAPAQAHPARDHHAHPALPAEPPGGVAVQILSNRELRRRRRIRRAYLYAINRARYYILIENAYFIPDRGVRRALERAVRRGVKVAIAVAGYNNILLAAMASRAIYAELLASGVRIFEWSGAMLHAKTAVIDDGWAVVGSYNFDHRSLIHNLEAVVVVADPLFARQLRDQTLADLAQCREVTPAEHASRPWRQILLDSAAYQLRYWL